MIRSRTKDCAALLSSYKGETVTPEEIQAALNRVHDWLAQNETWEEDLDGYHGIDLAQAVLAEFLEQLGLDPRLAYRQ
jgi:hypothetical protein